MVVNVDREPHPIANRNAIDLQTQIAASDVEYISFDAVHAEPEALVKTQIVDVRSRGRDQNARSPRGERSIEGCAYERGANTPPLLLLNHGDGFDFAIGAAGDQLDMAR